MSHLNRRLLAPLRFAVIACVALCTAVGGPRDIEAASRPPVEGRNGVVASGHSMASHVGLDVLEAGGNAVDAAVATAFALNVVAPYAGVIGGGGFMLIYRAEQGDVIAIDFREKAPAAAHRDMYLDEEGNVAERRSLDGYLAVGVPGGVAGLALALQDYGTWNMRQVLRPSIDLAARGIPVSADLHAAIAGRRGALLADPEAAAILLTDDGEPLPQGAVLRQRNLAWSLKRIARGGWEEFYHGRLADMIAEDMAANGGLITREDLAAYRPTIRQPVHGTYRGYDVWSMPPPSSGGIHLVQMLNVLEGYDLPSWGYGSADYVHHLAETMKLAYADRSKFLGDPAFVQVPRRGLMSKAYAAELREAVDPALARPSHEIAPGTPLRYESGQTTHLSVVDRWGNAVALTQTLNTNFGAAVVAGRTGIFLNNEMDDFSAKPGVPNAYGLVGGPANAVAPGKIPLSSMTPTIVTRNGKPFLVLGSPGGSTIITSVLQTILNVIDFKMDVQEAVDAPRVHHQWLPPVLVAERFALAPEVQSALEGRGQEVLAYGPPQRARTLGDVQAILIDPDSGRYYGASDPRREGGVAAY